MERFETREQAEAYLFKMRSLQCDRRGIPMFYDDSTELHKQGYFIDEY
jgi:hypothetical protein